MKPFPALPHARVRLPNGRTIRMHKVCVRVRHNSSRLCRTVSEEFFTVIAPTAAAAANLLREENAHIPETEITAWGPKGGEVTRYIGWESAIAHGLLESYSEPIQPDLLNKQSELFILHQQTPLVPRGIYK